MMGNSKSHNNYLVVKEMPQKGVNVNFPWCNGSSPSMKDGCTPLLCAISLNHVDIVKLLLTFGAYINKCDRNGCTPLYKAAFHGRRSLIELLTHSGADINLGDYLGKTPLYVCVNNAVVHSSYKQAIRTILASGAIVDKVDKFGLAPVHVAAQWKNNEVLAQLLAFKANVNLVDCKGRTPLFLVVASLSSVLFLEDLSFQLACIVSLFKAGADMLNLCEWIKLKGDGIPERMLNDLEDPSFILWYKQHALSPLSLKNICRKHLQRHMLLRWRSTELLCSATWRLPLPAELREYVSRRMLYRILDRSKSQLEEPRRTQSRYWMTNLSNDVME